MFRLSKPRDGFFVAPLRWGGSVGHEYDLGTNHREIHGRFGSVRMEGVGSQSGVREMATAWLNLGNRVGYVVRRLPKMKNIVQYHDQARGSDRVPKLQEWLSLVSGVAVEETAAADADHPVIPDEGKRGQAPFAGTARRVLRTKGACPLLPENPSLKRTRKHHDLPDYDPYPGGASAGRKRIAQARGIGQ